MFEGMLNDRVTLVKKDGTVAKENIHAMVQPKTIFMDDATLPIEPGDRLLRLLPSGLVDEYIVNEPGFYSGLRGMKAHFQTKVKRSDAPAAQPSTIINNIQGNNARVNINSTDNSQNLAMEIGASETLRALREELDRSSIPADDAHAIREAIEKMETAGSKEGFREGYQSFMAAAANHVTVFAPFLGALASFL
ncbi:hypothetical protein PhaeoP75_04478 (plasmid) [Phaeobacter gallaeciensis]|uniref:Uncharacterized protein n=1 Tax=Phaeobacter gallaeciensis TaxID=60890 RepID=A0AAC9ZE67_9RHOB|nr:hypothetical protein [Phaeobacter gallaeciensis]ATF04077.1 hypothetical protein PhaeoP75_04478 [Phaeobacter gallaeciensis]ATF08353.1 hypothetical protein PhaeoP63_04323 [Phaeobacter gallaeciensis]